MAVMTNHPVTHKREKPTCSEIHTEYCSDTVLANKIIWHLPSKKKKKKEADSVCFGTSWTLFFPNLVFFCYQESVLNQHCAPRDGSAGVFKRKFYAQW